MMGSSLVDKYGIEKVTEEIALYLKTNYPSKFSINIVCKNKIQEKIIMVQK